MLDLDHRNALKIKAVDGTVAVAGLDDMLRAIAIQVESRLLMRNSMKEVGQGVFLKFNSLNVYQQGHFFNPHEDFPVAANHVSGNVNVDLIKHVFVSQAQHTILQQSLDWHSGDSTSDITYRWRLELALDAD